LKFVPFVAGALLGLGALTPPVLASPSATATSTPAKGPPPKATLHHASKPALSAARSTLPPLPTLPVPVAVTPIAPLPMLPRLARVRIEAARDRVVVVEDVNLPRGDWQNGDLSFYASFGAPGTPVAVEAHLVPVPAGAPEARIEDAGEPVSVETAAHKGPGVQTLLGKPQMAGIVIRVNDAALRRALAASDVAALRVRTLLRPPAVDVAGARSLVVRLGAANGLPLTLGRIALVSMEPDRWVTRVESHLCGPDAETWPLSTALVTRGPTRGLERQALAIAPETAVRHATDDLCVRWWSTP
jgi:hypothetical protein